MVVFHGLILKATQYVHRCPLAPAPIFISIHIQNMYPTYASHVSPRKVSFMWDQTLHLDCFVTTPQPQLQKIVIYLTSIPV